MHQIKKDIQRKKARVAFLVQTVSENLPFTGDAFRNGFFTQAAESFEAYAAQAKEIAKLHGEIMQLSFDLESIEAEQSEFPLLSPARAFH